MAASSALRKQPELTSLLASAQENTCVQGLQSILQASGALYEESSK
jgi:hypothetical protein